MVLDVSLSFLVLGHCLLDVDGSWVGVKAGYRMFLFQGVGEAPF